ncbi:stage II sporulation protein M [Sporolactobacillus sp. THM7-7]|nr:stage II sporulation protein M [Sporolactobacillus sp. THM7-7]
MFRYRVKHLIFHHVKEHLSLYTFVTGLCLMGVVFGAIIVNSLPYESKNDLLNYLKQFFSELAAGEIAGSPILFKESLFRDLQYLGLIWLLGLSVIGLPIIFLLLFLKGMVLGFTVGFLISQMGLRGFLTVLVSVFPQNLLVIPLYLFITVASVAFSLKMIRQLLMKTRHHPILPQFVNYGLSFAGAALLLVVVSAYEAYISPVLIRLFIS